MRPDILTLSCNLLVSKPIGLSLKTLVSSALLNQHVYDFYLQYRLSMEVFLTNA